MKTFDIVWKVILTVAALAGLIFVAIKYGDKIVAWFKGLFCQKSGGVVDGETVPEEAPAEETPAEEAAADALDQAEEADFENC